MEIKSYNLENYQKEINTEIDKYKEQNIVQRLFDHDHTIWSESPDEITNRLGWLESFEETFNNVDEIISFVEECRNAGFKKVLLLGMGGSSLAPELFNEVFHESAKGLELRIADSTHPDKVRELKGYFNPSETLYIVSTKSGSTVETISLMNYFYNYCIDILGKENAGSHIVSITDPGSKLKEISEKLGFRKCFLNNPNIGGRFSVLSYFGLVPAALVGINIKAFLEKIIEYKGQLINNRIDLKSVTNPINLGATIGLFSNKGLDKLTFLISDDLINFGDWIEQLIAESSGKERKGILPVIEKNIDNINSYSKDRAFVCISLKDDPVIVNKSEIVKKNGFPLIHINLDDKLDLGIEFYRWEIITAIACAVLKVNPFDQPNVESTKMIARQFLDEYKDKGEITEPDYYEVENGIKIVANTKPKNLSDAINKLINTDGNMKNKYISIQAYISQNPENMNKLEVLKSEIQNKSGIPVTIGFGPRFLHSTGQLHKGDSGNGLFIQIVSEPKEDIYIPDNAGDNKSSLSFGNLLKAQYLGDRSALIDAGRELITINIGSNIKEGLLNIANSIGN